MSVPPNIEVFNQVAARTFARLYEAFPSPITLDPDLIGLDVVLEEKYEPDSPQHRALVNSTADTIRYLIEESLIRIDDQHGNISERGFPGAVLTGHAFSLLQNTPEAVDAGTDRRPIGERLRAWVASGAKVVGSESVAGLIARLLAG